MLLLSFLLILATACAGSLFLRGFFADSASKLLIVIGSVIGALVTCVACMFAIGAAVESTLTGDAHGNAFALVGVFFFALIGSLLLPPILAFGTKDFRKKLMFFFIGLSVLLASAVTYQVLTFDPEAIRARTEVEDLEDLREQSRNDPGQVCQRMVLFDDATDIEMKNCQARIDHLLEAKDTAYDGFLELRRFTDLQGYAKKWADGRPMVPAPLQSWFLETYLSEWMKDERFTKEVESGDLEHFLESLNDPLWSLEARRHFVKTHGDALKRRLKVEKLPPVDELLKAVAQ